MADATAVQTPWYAVGGNYNPVNWGPALSGQYDVMKQQDPSAIAALLAGLGGVISDKDSWQAQLAGLAGGMSQNQLAKQDLEKKMKKPVTVPTEQMQTLGGLQAPTNFNLGFQNTDFGLFNPPQFK
jgi:hypothetical protein